MKTTQRNGKAILRVLRSGLFALMISIVAIAGSSSALAQKGIPVAIAGTTLGIQNVPEFIAMKLGYFADAGIDLTRQQYKGGSDAVNAMISGNADVGSNFFDNVIPLAAKGQRVKSFVNDQVLGGMVILSGPGSNIKSISDLTGKIVGVTSPGSGSDLMLRYALGKVGIKAEDVPVVGVGIGDTAVLAIEKRHVQALVTVEPAVTLLESRNPGQITVLADTRNAKGAQAIFGTPSYAAHSLIARDDWLKKNPETARRLATAIVRALQWIHSHSPEQILAELPDGKLGALPRESAISVIKGAIPTYSTDGRMTQEAAQIVYTVFAAADPKLAQMKINVDELYTNEYLPK